MTKLLLKDIPRYNVTKNVQCNGTTGKDFQVSTQLVMENSLFLDFTVAIVTYAKLLKKLSR